MIEDTIRIKDLEALAQERGIQPETLESIYLRAACTVLELHDVRAEVLNAPPEAVADAATMGVIDDRLAPSSIASFFQLHGVDPELGLYTFKCIARGLIRGGSECGIPLSDEPLEDSLERNGWVAEILKSTFSAEELETAVRVEQALARRGLSADQVDELLPPRPPSEQ